MRGSWCWGRDESAWSCSGRCWEAGAGWRCAPSSSRGCWPWRWRWRQRRGRRGGCRTSRPTARATSGRTAPALWAAAPARSPCTYLATARLSGTRTGAVHIIRAGQRESSGRYSEGSARKSKGKISETYQGAFDSAKNHKRQRRKRQCRKRQSLTAKRGKSLTPKVLTAILTLPNLT